VGFGTCALDGFARFGAGSVVVASADAKLLEPQRRYGAALTAEVPVVAFVHFFGTAEVTARLWCAGGVAAVGDLRSVADDAPPMARASRLGGKSPPADWRLVAQHVLLSDVVPPRAEGGGGLPGGGSAFAALAPVVGAHWSAAQAAGPWGTDDVTGERRGAPRPAKSGADAPAPDDGDTSAARLCFWGTSGSADGVRTGWSVLAGRLADRHGWRVSYLRSDQPDASEGGGAGVARVDEMFERRGADVVDTWQHVPEGFAPAEGRQGPMATPRAAAEGMARHCAGALALLAANGSESLESLTPRLAAQVCGGGPGRDSWGPAYARWVLRGMSGMVAALRRCDAVVGGAAGDSDAVLVAAARAAGVRAVVLEVCTLHHGVVSGPTLLADALTAPSVFARDSAAVEAAWAAGASTCRAGRSSLGWRGMGPAELPASALPLAVAGLQRLGRTTPAGAAGPSPEELFARGRDPLPRTADIFRWCGAREPVRPAGARTTPLVTMPLGVAPPPDDVIPWAARPAPTARGDGRRVCLSLAFVGRLSPEKSPGLALRAAATAAGAVVAEDASCMVHLDVFGDGPLAASLVRLASSLSRRTAVHVVFHGWADEADIWSRLRVVRAVLLMPTMLSETFGLVAASAMAQGVPVATWAVGGMAEFCHNGTSALLLPHPSDLTAVAASLIRHFSASASEAAVSAVGDMVRSAARMVRRRMNVDVTAAGYDKLLRCLVACGGNEPGCSEDCAASMSVL